MRRVGIAARKVTRGARQCLAPARIALGEERRDAQANEVACQCLRTIALVLDPSQIVFMRIGDDRLARHVEQRSREQPAIELRARAHAARAARAGAAQEAHQHRFRLIVQLMRERQHVERQLA